VEALIDFSIEGCSGKSTQAALNEIGFDETMLKLCWSPGQSNTDEDAAKRMQQLVVIFTLAIGLFIFLLLTVPFQDLQTAEMINLKDVAGQTALIAAAIGGHAGCLEILRSSNLMNFTCYRILSK
jgi:hypothetical protein